MSDTSKTKTVSWWTSDGWRQLPEPERWRLANDGFGEVNPPRIAAGYRDTHLFGGIDVTNAIEITIWRHDDEASVVELSDINTQLTEFFVEEQHLPAFMLDKLPQIVAALTMPEIASSLSLINKVMVAFIRHGHGAQTIDAYGSFTRDDRLRMEEEERVEAAKARKRREDGVGR